ncbi:MAG: hypothetical protein WBQ24_02900 [Xanthobacteraceae bacterium]
MRASRRLRRNGFATGLTGGLAIGFACVAIVGSVNAALAECKPGHYRPPYFIKTMGQCGFNSETLSFRGTPAQQAMCLMRGMDATRNLGPPLEGLPPGLAKRIGETSGLPTRETLSAYLSKLDLEWDFAAYLWQPLSRAHDNDPDAPMAKYFVIHDTSGPYYGHRAFPDDININPKVNNLLSFACSDEWGKAHVVVNRMGDSLLNHDFSIPWRETKFEQAAEFGGVLKGLFVHIEMIQPRRAGAGRGDGHSPDPAFTPAQYDRLALLYTIVSVRAGRWLVPAFHAALDADIHNGHDDPLNFKVDSFADGIDRLMEKLQGARQYQASNATTATDAQADASPPTSDGFWIDALWGTPHKTAAAPATASADGVSKIPADAAADSAAVKPPDAAAAEPNSNPAPNSPAAPAAAAVKSPPLPIPRPDIKVAERESEAPREQKSAAAKDCTTHRAKGYRHQSCDPDSAVDGTRHHVSDARAHHVRGSSRHHRS